MLSIIKQITKQFNIMSKGTVKFFNESKGFGFIVEEGNNSEHFVHVSGLIDEIRENDEVEFELQEGRKGLNAVNVRVI
jgi:CspA family cold shock protein